MNNIRNPIFIVGHSRSGSTLLASLLNEHSAILALPETHFMDNTFSRSIFTRIKEKVFNNSIIEQMYEKNWRTQDTGVSKKDFKNALLTEGGQSYKDAFHILLFTCLERSSKRRILEKTPRHIEYVKQILEWFPDAKIICIIRDGRDAVYSLMNVPWAHNCMYKHAAYWAWCVRKSISYRESFPNHFYLLRYEDLLEDPERILGNVCIFLGEDFEKDMLLSRQSGVVPSWEKEWKKNSTRMIDASNAYKWKRRINSSSSIVDSCAFMNDELLLMGYEGVNVKIDHISIIERLQWNKWSFSLAYLVISLFRRYLISSSKDYRQKISDL